MNPGRSASSGVCEERERARIETFNLESASARAEIRAQLRTGKNTRGLFAAVNGAARPWPAGHASSPYRPETLFGRLRRTIKSWRGKRSGSSMPADCCALGGDARLP
jgi:hypothetical protein